MVTVVTVGAVARHVAITVIVIVAIGTITVTAATAMCLSP
jgi:hypothetical protein